MDARRGLAPQRALLSLITANLGLEFSTRMLHVALAPNTAPVEVALHYRKLDDVASFLFRFVAPEHCRPRELVDPVTGGRVYSDPYTGTYLNKLHRRLRQRDPTAFSRVIMRLIGTRVCPRLMLQRASLSPGGSSSFRSDRP